MRSCRLKSRLPVQHLLHEVARIDGQRSVELTKDLEAELLIEGTGLKFIGIQPHQVTLPPSRLILGGLEQRRADALTTEIVRQRNHLDEELTPARLRPQAA